MKNYELSWGSHRLCLGERTCIMGVLNVTPDSFSDGGAFFQLDKAVDHGERLVKEGADILDVGGESTRPFSEPLSAEEEIQRVIPVIEKLSHRVSVPISIDTTKAQVAREALSAGACMINDIGALRFDPELAVVAAEHNVPIVLMHMKGTPKTMQVEPHYDDLIAEIKAFLVNAVARAEKKGVPRSLIVVDPGIGFGKTFDHNLELLNQLHAFRTMNLPILVGPSRKAFIRNILKDKHSKDIRPDSEIVELGTQAAIAAAVLRGADIIRVHDVARTKLTLKIIDAIKKSRTDV